MLSCPVPEDPDRLRDFVHAIVVEGEQDDNIDRKLWQGFKGIIERHRADIQSSVSKDGFEKTVNTIMGTADRTNLDPNFLIGLTFALHRSEGIKWIGMRFGPLVSCLRTRLDDAVQQVEIQTQYQLVRTLSSALDAYDGQKDRWTPSGGTSRSPAQAARRPEQNKGTPSSPKPLPMPIKPYAESPMMKAPTKRSGAMRARWLKARQSWPVPLRRWIRRNSSMPFRRNRICKTWSSPWAMWSTLSMPCTTAYGMQCRGRRGGMQPSGVRIFGPGKGVPPSGRLCTKQCPAAGKRNSSAACTHSSNKPGKPGIRLRRTASFAS